MNFLQAGVATVDITPPLGTLINGDFITHYATHIHDRLYARALVLEQAGRLVAICVADICAMRRPLLDEVKTAVQQVTGIPPGHVLISSTHTHAGGSVESLLVGAADLSYRQKLPALLVQAIAEAWQNLQPAVTGFGSADAPEYVLCRRYFMQEEYVALNPVTGRRDQVKTNPFGAEHQIVAPASGVDPQLCYMAVKNSAGRLMCVLGNYSMHYVGDWPDGTISADYFGAFSRHLARKLEVDDSFVGMLCNGTSGEANIWDFRDPSRFPAGYFEKSELIGQALAAKVAGSLGSINWQPEAVLDVRYEDLSVGTRKPNRSQLEEAAGIVAQTQYELLRGIDYHVMRSVYARELLLLNEYPGSVSFPVQLLRIGRILIGGLGGEFFAETGLALKAAAGPLHYFTIGLANDYVGYVCPEGEIERGGYEAWLCRTSFLALDAERQIRDRMTAFIAGTQA